MRYALLLSSQLRNLRHREVIIHSRSSLLSGWAGMQTQAVRLYNVLLAATLHCLYVELWSDNCLTSIVAGISGD